MPNSNITPKTNPNRTVIDVSAPDDNEVIVISSCDLSDIECSLHSILNAFEKFGDVFYQIEKGEIKDTRAIAHLLQYTANYMCNFTHDNKAILTKALEQSRFNRKEV